MQTERKATHDDVIKWKHFPRYWHFVRGIHRSPVNSPHKGQWRGALIFSFICAWINGWVNTREAGDLRRYHAYYDVIIMANWTWPILVWCQPSHEMSWHGKALCITLKFTVISRLALKHQLRFTLLQQLTRENVYVSSHKMIKVIKLFVCTYVMPNIGFIAHRCKFMKTSSKNRTTHQKVKASSGPFYGHGLTLIPAWININNHYKVWDEITYPFLNFNGSTVEVKNG